MKFLNKMFFPKKESTAFNLEKYMRDLESNEFKDLFCLGISEKNQGTWLKKEFTKEPNALYVGSMGSGKSVAATFTTITWMLANNDKTILFIIDPLKGASDYQALFGQPNVYEVFGSKEKIHRVIDLVYDELMKREEEFRKLKAENIDTYEKKARMQKLEHSKIARIILLMEEFHAIPPEIEYDRNYKKKNTTAQKFHQIMKVGRSQGIWVIACSQRGTNSDVPTTIVNNFTQKQIFKVNQVEATYLISNTAPSKLTSNQKGRCYTDYGAVQFPYIPIDTQKELIKKYLKPYNAHCSYITDREMVDRYLEGESTEEIYKFKKLSHLVEGIESYDASMVINILHKKMGHKVEQKDITIDDYGVSHLVSYREDDEDEDTRIAVSIRIGKKLTPKHISRLERGMDEYECPFGIIYTSAEDIQKTLYEMAVNKNIELVDYEDMLRFAKKVERTDGDADFDPTQLADDSKENGFDELPDLSKEKEAEKARLKEEKALKLQKIQEQKDKDLEKLKEEIAAQEEEVLGNIESSPEEEVVDHGIDLSESQKIELPEEKIKELDPLGDQLKLDEDLEESIRQMISKPSPSIVKTLGGQGEKKPEVKSSFRIQRDEIPSVLFHLYKNKDEEVYRILFLVMSENKILHKFYLDREVTRNFSTKDKLKLGIKTTNDWNNQESVLDIKSFDESMNEYFDNFKLSDLSVHSVCWQEDFGFLSKYTKDNYYMVDYPSLIDEWIDDLYNDHYSREETLKMSKIEVEKGNFFGDILADYELWKKLN